MSAIVLNRLFRGGPLRKAAPALTSVVLILGCLLAMPKDVSADELTIAAWDLGCGASNPSISEDVSAFFDTVQSPFVGEHGVSLTSSPETTSSAQYLIEYFSNYGSFHIASQQQAHGLASSSIYTGAGGYIRVSVSEPLPLHIDSSWSYALPADFMMTQFGLGIGGDSSQTVLFRQSYSRVTLPGEPSSGTLPIQGDVVLLPGETWRIQYWMNLEADAGPNFSATGSGYVNLTISPEVSSLALLSFALLCAFARRQRAIPR